jgi:hypothetical protein
MIMVMVGNGNDGLFCVNVVDSPQVAQTLLQIQVVFGMVKPADIASLQVLTKTYSVLTYVVGYCLNVSVFCSFSSPSVRVCV